MFWLNEVNDYSETYYPIFLEIRRHFWTNFHLDYWRDGILGGLPLFGDPFAMLLNPLNWLVLIMDPRWFFPLAALIAFFLGSLGIKKLLSQIDKKNKYIKFFSAIYMIMPLSMAHLKAGHLNIYQAVSFFPWIIYFFLKHRQKRSEKDILFAAIFSLLVLFSHPGMFYIFNLFLLPFLFFFFIRKEIELKIFVNYGILILSLGAVYFLPAIQLNQFITRTAVNPADVVPVWTLKSLMGGLLFPYPKIADIDQEAILYPGLITSLLAFWALVKSRRGIKLSAFIILFLSFILSLGNLTPFYQFILRWLPFANTLRVSSRFWFIALLLIIILAYQGWRQIRNKKKQVILLVLILSELFIFAVLRLGLPGRYGRIADLAVYQIMADSADKFRVYATNHQLSQRKMAETNAVLADGEYPLQLSSYIKYLHAAGGYQFSGYSVIHPPYQVHQFQPQPNSELLGKINVLYAVSPYPLKDKGFEKILAENNLILYKNLNFRKKLWLDNGDLQLISYYSEINSADKNPLFNHVQAVFKVNKETWVNWANNYYPGWQVKIDGRQVRIVSQNSWVKFKVSPGKHRFEARFDNRMFKLGGGISLAAVLLVAVWLSRKKSVLEN